MGLADILKSFSSILSNFKENERLPVILFIGVLALVGIAWKNPTVISNRGAVRGYIIEFLLILISALLIIVWLKKGAVNWKTFFMWIIFLLLIIFILFIIVFMPNLIEYLENKTIPPLSPKNKSEKAIDEPIAKDTLENEGIYISKESQPPTTPANDVTEAVSPPMNRHIVKTDSIIVSGRTDIPDAVLFDTVNIFRPSFMKDSLKIYVDGKEPIIIGTNDYYVSAKVKAGTTHSFEFYKGDSLLRSIKNIVTEKVGTKKLELKPFAN